MLDRYFKIDSREREAVNWITRGVPAGVDDPAQAGLYWAGAVNGIITNDPGTILASAGRAGVRSRPLSPAA